MIIITSNILSGDIVEVQVEGRSTSEDEIRLAYKALSEVVDGLCSNNKEGGKENGQ